MTRNLSIGALAQASGVNLETIRYYERIGLMPAPGRTDGGHRVYEPAHERRLAFIRRGRELGFGIENIRTLLNLADVSDQPCGEVRSIAAKHLDDVRAKIADLTRLERILAERVAQCTPDERGGGCAVLDMLGPTA